MVMKPQPVGNDLRIARPVLLGLVLVAVVACQTDGQLGARPEVSLEQAKQITATFEDATFVAPPRSVDDITRLLASKSGDASDSTVELRKAAFAPMPSELKYIGGARFGNRNETGPGYGERPMVLQRKKFEFLLARALARRQLGLAGLELQDMRSIATAANVILDPNSSKGRLVIEAAWTEFNYGSKRRAVTLMERAAQHEDRLGGGFAAEAWSGLVELQARTGDVVAAEGAQEAFEKSAARPGFSPWRRIYVLTTQAALLEAQGKWDESERFHRAALREHDGLKEAERRLDWADQRQVLLAANLIEQGRLDEAEAVLRDVLITVVERNGGKGTMQAAVSLRKLAQNLVLQNRLEDANILAHEALEIVQSLDLLEGTTTDFQTLLAEILVAQRRYVEAVEIYDVAATSALTPRRSKNYDLVDAPYLLVHQEIQSSTSRLIALTKSGRAAEAIEPARLKLQMNQELFGERHYLTAESHAILGAALAETGSDEAALQQFEDATITLLGQSGQLDLDSGNRVASNHRLIPALEVYLELLAKAHTDQAGIPDAAGTAFQIAGFARTRSVEQALAASSARARIEDPELADLARREQDAQRQIAALYGILAESTGSADVDELAIDKLRQRIDALQGSRRALLQVIEERFPDYSQLINPRPADIAQVRDSLLLDEALIAFYVAEDQTYVWAIPAVGEVAFYAAPIGRAELNAVVDELRLALDPQAVTLGDIPEFDIGLAHELYELLLQPVAASWQDAAQLLVVKDAGLGQLPLSILVTEPFELAPEATPLFARYGEVPWLVRSHGVTVLPSASSLVTLRALPRGAQSRLAFAGFGDPWFSVEQAEKAALAGKGGDDFATRGVLQVRGMPFVRRSVPLTRDQASAELATLPRLPDTADEVRAIAVALNADLTTDVFIGDQVNETAIKAMDLSNRRVIAFATHGLVPGDLNGLTQPALALSSPLVAGGDDDGLLTMSEILGLRLDADWVVLSACNTGSANGAGAEAISGLGQAFFYAGARALLVTNWPVETTSARILTTELFRKQAEDPSLARAEALRRSMLGLIDSPGFTGPDGEILFSYAHPIFWAPFSLIGDGGLNSSVL